MAATTLQPPPQQTNITAPRDGGIQAGDPVSALWFNWFTQLVSAVDALQSDVAAGYTGKVVIPKISSTEGSLTVVDGIITAYTAPT